MSRRKEANRAEAIVRGVGALVMVLVLAVMIFALPQILKGKDTGQMMDTMIHMVVGFAVFGLVIGVIGLIVWFKVLKRKK
jgi:drug/metabolite transporter (DMT)-like permease